MPLWSIFGAIVPAVLLYIILFMETQICQLIMMERTKVRYSLHHHLHGDPDLPAHHDGEN
jgi:hypothetical protein